MHREIQGKWTELDRQFDCQYHNGTLTNFALSVNLSNTRIIAEGTPHGTFRVLFTLGGDLCQVFYTHDFVVYALPTPPQVDRKSLARLKRRPHVVDACPGITVSTWYVKPARIVTGTMVAVTATLDPTQSPALPLHTAVKSKKRDYRTALGHSRNASTSHKMKKQKCETLEEALRLANEELRLAALDLDEHTLELETAKQALATATTARASAFE